MKYIEVGVIAFMVSYILTPYMARVGKKQNMIDMPGHRKIHEEAIPNLGGIVIFFGFLLSLLFVVQIEGQIKALLIGGVIILLLGVVDDIVDLSPKHKFIIQMVPALIVIIYNSDLINSFIVNQLKIFDLLGYLLYPILIFWIVGVTNAINLIDGLDGLACGISLIALVTFLILGLRQNLEALSLISIALAGSILAFLKFNFYPAKIFLGDSGSTFAGFMLASIGALWVLNSGNAFFILIPIIILALPIVDTLFAIWRRYRGHYPIFQADKGHLHHRLLTRGIAHKNVVFILWGISAICSVIALVLAL
ncbi:MAG: undecaprenyl/decaprenyl-phosphate alpha-N-acetylglucosaminyl 1-phosphate transferase [Actinobacteria bacterium]|nr:undecaprenyl/decaprenyl-phosphate alpha-N-acetylglucosaminyl 1-phosphate transferase [Candidatus Atribacteria bacterium]MBE3113267.1 undecaprenyl/decaprenyl-phosphate alpha-N-acetylglucosaminyl 1-phosphate transferase [Actinomycetota bacterium]MBE3127237.1 undecaprenyl/decaprenyl-phosphate alpha-N-acetylglucosaminyl 1-phosphate transferase [Candidatus Atribacteria bacterium]